MVHGQSLFLSVLLETNFVLPSENASAGPVWPHSKLRARKSPPRRCRPSPPRSGRRTNRSGPSRSGDSTPS